MSGCPLFRPVCPWCSEFASLNLHFALNPELLDTLAQRGARDAEQLGRLQLVVAGLLERLDHQFAFDGSIRSNFGSREEWWEGWPTSSRLFGFGLVIFCSPGGSICGLL